MAQTYVIGRVTADLELKTSIHNHPYVRFDIAENIGSKERSRTQYLQICAMGDDAGRLMRARVKKRQLYLGVRILGAGGILQEGWRHR